MLFTEATGGSGLVFGAVVTAHYGIRYIAFTTQCSLQKRPGVAELVFGAVVTAHYGIRYIAFSDLMLFTVVTGGSGAGFWRRDDGALRSVPA